LFPISSTPYDIKDSSQLGDHVQPAATAVDSDALAAFSDCS
jgi:hypothetical protein